MNFNIIIPLQWFACFLIFKTFKRNQVNHLVYLNKQVKPYSHVVRNIQFHLRVNWSLYHIACVGVSNINT